MCFAQGRLPLSECLDDLRIELLAGLREDLLLRGRPAERASVRTVARHRVECVGDGEDARGERNLLAREAIRVAAPVPTLVMRADDAQPFTTQDLDAREHLLAENGVLLHPSPLP